MQLLAKNGTEDGKQRYWFADGSILSLKNKTKNILPHIGFNEITSDKKVNYLKM